MAPGYQGPALYPVVGAIVTEIEAMKMLAAWTPSCSRRAVSLAPKARFACTWTATTPR